MSNLKSQEFRVGNLLQDQLGNLLKITDLNDGVQGITYRPLDKRKKLPKECIRAEQIPLTKEWLVKFGFEEKNLNFYRDSIEMYFQRTYKQYYFKYGFKEGKGMAMPINYVHQLQNLYFALTGEELK